MATDPEATDNLAMFAEETLTPEAAATQRNLELLTRWAEAYAQELYERPPINSCDVEKAGEVKARAACAEFGQKDIQRAFVAASRAGLLVLTPSEVLRFARFRAFGSPTPEDEAFIGRMMDLIEAAMEVQSTARAPP